jgi:hypothetical protein
MKSKQAAFTEWLWSKKGNNLAFFPNTLTNSNLSDQSLPRPTLSPVEAEGLFRYLEEQRLVFPKETSQGTAYCLNEMKEREWTEVIKDLKKPKWLRSKSLKITGKILLFILCAFIGGYLGRVAEKMVDKSFDKGGISVGGNAPKPNVPKP